MPFLRDSSGKKMETTLVSCAGETLPRTSFLHQDVQKMTLSHPPTCLLAITNHLKNTLRVSDQPLFNAAKCEIQCLRIERSSTEVSSYAGEMSGNALSTFTSTKPRIRASDLLLTASTHRPR